MTAPDAPLLFSWLPAELRAELVLYSPAESLLVLLHVPGFRLTERQLATSVSCLCDWAAEHGFLTLLAWGRCYGAELGFGAWVRAAEGGHVRVLEWLLAKRVPYERREDFVTCRAAHGGRLEALQWLVAHGFSTTSEALEHAASQGHVAVMEYLEGLVKIPSVKNERVCITAAHGGHVRALAWARARGYPWSAIVARVAATRGHADALSWLIKNDCPYVNLDCMEAAIVNGRTAVMIVLDDIRVRTSATARGESLDVDMTSSAL
jgi:hypothetical protein